MAFAHNDRDQELRDVFRKDTEVPSVVTDRVREAFGVIRDGDIAKERKKLYRRRKLMMKFAGGTAAVLVGGIVFCAVNPVMAKDLPLIGNLFERLQYQVSFFGDFSEKAQPLSGPTEENQLDQSQKNAENGDEVSDDKGEVNESGKEEESGEGAQEADNHPVSGENSFQAFSDGLTITLSEIYANDQAVYITMLAESEEPFPETMMSTNESGTQYPWIEMDLKTVYSFEEEPNDSYINDNIAPEGIFLDEYTYSSILRLDLSKFTEDDTEYVEKYREMGEQILAEMGISLTDIDPGTEEGQALLTQFDEEIQRRKGGLEVYKKQRELPEEFSLRLDIRNFVGNKANPEYWDSGYSDEEIQQMTEEQLDEVYAQQPEEYNQYPNKYFNYWFDGTWSFDIPVQIDRSRTETLEINEVGENGVGLKSVIRTPYELVFNEMYAENANADVFLVALDADGNKLPYNSSFKNCNYFTIQDRDISTVDVYILDYVQYMDELKGVEYYNGNEDRPEEEKWGTLLGKYAKYHRTLHFD